ncbi:SDR family oxidoreductase [Pararhizobium sp. IMCC21322]|uniref:SDR family oxidoreductase n=1 Tax=Pararhizobium sp. IMCC21322 TaxID=3067903 RepID=UPI0027412901|nr:SDR family oxidoreductase [Pararhizobium sp. IMCC21322]
MQNRWNDGDAAIHTSDLELRAYTSRLIGMDTDLVLHGGGNTSVKSVHLDRFGVEHEAIWVKASGYDLGQMWTEGFTGLQLNPLLQLAQLDQLSDPDMVNDVNCARFDSNAANPSIEAIVHAVIPYKFVDHTHANAVLTISNSAPAMFKEIYGDDVLVLPYVKPGFDLALQFRDVVERGLLEQYTAIILQHHGVFTYAENARTAYDRMIDVVERAEAALAVRVGAAVRPVLAAQNSVEIARARKAVSDAFGKAVLSLPAGSVEPGQVHAMAEQARHGTLTPEHVIHNKPFPAVIGERPAEAIATFASAYESYVDLHNNPHLTMMPAAPHWALFESGHVRSFGLNFKRATISRDVSEATTEALRCAAELGNWQGLSSENLRDLEYWELEQDKLKRQKPDADLAGKIAIVSGAATGIGHACAHVLRERGAVVVGLDINPNILSSMSQADFQGIVVDLTEEVQVTAALEHVVESFGGLDIVVSNAGIFETGQTVETMENAVWDAALAVNLTSHRMLIKHAVPFLRHGIDPAIVFIGSRNVAAPGGGASAYSVSKAGLTQLMRVLALELAGEGITVNAVHPDAVFDTNLWTPEALKKSADRYGLSIDQYKTRNLLGCEVTSRDVGLAVAAFVDGTLSRTTGAQMPVDGGNDRVI